MKLLKPAVGPLFGAKDACGAYGLLVPLLVAGVYPLVLTGAYGLLPTGALEAALAAALAALALAARPRNGVEVFVGGATYLECEDDFLPPPGVLAIPMPKAGLAPVAAGAGAIKLLRIGIGDAPAVAAPPYLRNEIGRAHV